MSSTMVTIEIEAEVFWQEQRGNITPTSVVIHTIMPKEAEPAMKVLALDQFDRMVFRGQVTP